METRETLGEGGGERPGGHNTVIDMTREQSGPDFQPNLCITHNIIVSFTVATNSKEQEP